MRSTFTFAFESGGRIPRREFMRDVPKHFDGGDVDDNGRWYGNEMSCLECHETGHVRLGFTATYLLAQLQCGNCGARFAEVRQ